MKKTITLLAMTAVSGVAMAQTPITLTPGSNIPVCAAAAAKPILGDAGATVSGAPVTAANTFIKTAFSITCGSNTHAYANNGYALGTGFAVASGSTKGNQTFRGGANSGGIALSAGCPATGCTTTDVSTAVALAVTNGS